MSNPDKSDADAQPRGRRDAGIGTSAGLVQYKAGKFQRHSLKNGIPQGSVTSPFVDYTQCVWVVIGDRLVRFDRGGAGKFEPLRDFPPTPVRGVVEDRAHKLYVTAFDELPKTVAW